MTSVGVLGGGATPGSELAGHPVGLVRAMLRAVQLQRRLPSLPCLVGTTERGAGVAEAVQGVGLAVGVADGPVQLDRVPVVGQRGEEPATALGHITEAVPGI